MNKKNNLYLKILFLFVLFLFASSLKGSADSNYVGYSYSVKVGDKIDYHLDTLTNGTQKGNFSVYGLNMTEGDNFQMVINKSNTNPITSVGADFTLRFDMGSQTSNTFSGNFYLFTNNETYWTSKALVNSNYTLFGKIWYYTHNSTSGTFSYNVNANNFGKIVFNLKDGLVASYEYQTSYISGSTFTHIKFTKIATSSSTVSSKGLPGFDIFSGLVSLIFIGAIAIELKRKKF